MGADLAYVGSAFIATHEARASDEYKQAIVASSAADIVYSNLFTGIHGNYLRSSIVAAGLDPDNLPQPGADAMNFQSATRRQGLARHLGIGAGRRRGRCCDAGRRARRETVRGISGREGAALR